MQKQEQSGTIRYSDKELNAFKTFIEGKLEKSNKDLEFTLGQIENLTEARDNEGDWMDDTSSMSELEMLYTMANRSRKHIRDLENALLRIKNKSYGICVVSGTLIDMKRLMAVPTTTKSLAAKNTKTVSENKVRRPIVVKPPEERQIISKIISKPTVKTPIKIDDDFDNDFDQAFDIEDMNYLDIP